MRHLYEAFVAVIHIKIAVEFANYKIIILNQLHKKGGLHDPLCFRDTTQRYIEKDEDIIYTVTAVKNHTKRYK
jgi:hypothetical protein